MPSSFIARAGSLTFAVTVLCALSLAQGGPDGSFVSLEAGCAEQSEPQSLAPPPGTQPGASDGSRDRIFYPRDTENPKLLPRKLLRNVLRDQKEIWTSPFRMRATDAKYWIGFSAVTAALIATDHRTSTAFENSKGQLAWGNDLSKIGASYTLLPIVAGFYTYGVLRNDAKPREVGVLGAETLLDSLIVVQILKPLAGRQRPDSHGEKGQFFDAGSSFPSGHAIASWSLASLIAHEYSHNKIVPVAAYALAAVVSTSRFAAQQHYASDIFLGGAMGWFIGRYVYKTHMDRALHQQAAWELKILPEAQPSKRSYGVTLALGIR